MGSKKVRGHSKYSFCWWWKPNLETWCLAVQQVNFILKFSVVYSANEDFDSTFKSNEVVYHTGEVNWVPPGIFLASCKMDITYFPFDEQTCYLKVFILTSASFFLQFSSWTYHGHALDLHIIKEDGEGKIFFNKGMSLFTKHLWTYQPIHQVVSGNSWVHLLSAKSS